MAVLDSVHFISLKNTKWAYRGEGNANLVISIPEDKVILRFEKHTYGTNTSNEIISKREKKLKMDVMFYKKIIVAFLGKAFIVSPFLGKISKDEVVCLDQELLPQRPNYRLDKGIQYEMVTIHPDYTYLPPLFETNNQLQNGDLSNGAEFKFTTFAIEIKPKQGWVFPKDRLHPKCTYCLNQYLKLKNMPKSATAPLKRPRCKGQGTKDIFRGCPTVPLQEITPEDIAALTMDPDFAPMGSDFENRGSEDDWVEDEVLESGEEEEEDEEEPLEVKKKRVMRISQYCPLDLFSGNLFRMKKAIKNLLSTPQNNLKIFRNGQLVYSDECKGNHFNILKEWLEPCENGKITTQERLLEKWTNLIMNALLRELTEEPSFILPNCDFENGEIRYSHSPLFGKIKPCDWSPHELPSNCILNRILTLQKLQNIPFTQLYDLYRERKHFDGDYNYVEKLLLSPEEIGSIERYLLSTTAKDCSIFIAFHRINSKIVNGLQYIQDLDGTFYQLNIGISDIDPKPLSCIEKHFKRDRDIVSTILHHIKEGG